MWLVGIGCEVLEEAIEAAAAGGHLHVRCKLIESGEWIIQNIYPTRRSCNGCSGRRISGLPPEQRSKLQPMVIFTY